MPGIRLDFMKEFIMKKSLSLILASVVVLAAVSQAKAAIPLYVPSSIKSGVSVVTADFDQDGKIDVITGSAYNNFDMNTVGYRNMDDNGKIYFMESNVYFT